MKRFKVKHAIGLSLPILVALFVVVSMFWVDNVSKVVPDSIRHQANFSILLPAGRDYNIDKSSIRYSNEARVFTVEVTHEGRKIILTEQATPSLFAGVPDFLKLKFKTLKDSQTLGTSHGAAYIGKDPQQNNQQISALDAEGTTIFAKVDQEMSIEEWRLFYRAMTPIEEKK